MDLAGAGGLGTACVTLLWTCCANQASIERRTVVLISATFPVLNFCYECSIDCFVVVRSYVDSREAMTQGAIDSKLLLVGRLHIPRRNTQEHASVPYLTSHQASRIDNLSYVPSTRVVFVARNAGRSLTDACDAYYAPLSLCVSLPRTSSFLEGHSAQQQGAGSLHLPIKPQGPCERTAKNCKC